MGKKLKALKQALFGRKPSGYALLDKSTTEPVRRQSVTLFDEAARRSQAAEQLAASQDNDNMSTAFLASVKK